MHRILVISDADQLKETINQLKTSKTTTKGKLTRQRTYLSSCLDSASAIDFCEMEMRFKSLSEIHAAFSEIIDHLIAYTKVKTEQEAYERELEVFESEYFKLQGEFKKVLDINHKIEDKQNVLVLKTDNGENFALNQCGHSKQNHLPEIKLPKFDGKFDHWLQFRELFDSIVLKADTPLKPAEKIQYLLGSLPEDISRTFETIQYSEEGFNVIWSELKDRFENKVVLVDKLISEMFKVKPVPKDSPEDLRRLIDSFTFNLNQLKLLGQEVDKWDMLIINLVKHRLDEDLRKSWDRWVLRFKKEANQNQQQLPTWKNMKDFLQDQYQVLEQSQYKKRPQSTKVSDSKVTPFKPVRNFHSSQENSNPSYVIKCSICKENHKTFKCPELEKLKTPQEKLKKVNEFKLCHNCLKLGHSKSSCTNQGVCFYCKEKHHSILCFKGNKSKPNENESKSIIISGHTWFNSGSKQVFLSTAIVNIEDRYGNLHKCRALLDSGSQSCFVSKGLAAELQLKKRPANVSVLGLNQNPVSVDGSIVTTVSSRVNNFHDSFMFLVVPEITDVIPSQKISIDPKIQVPAYIADNLADPFFHVPAKIDMIIGAEYFYDLLKPKTYIVENTQMKLRESVLGWIVTGTFQQTQNSNTIRCNFSSSTILNNMERDLRKFLEVESCETTKKAPTEEDEYCEKLYQETTYQNEDGRFVVTLPLKPNVIHLGSNESSATKRLLYMENKLKNDPEKREMYQEFLDEYESLGHMVEDSEPKDSNQIQYYLPHHAVMKPDSTTTRLRVVFDGSAKSETGLSLNDCLYAGPFYQKDVVAHLLKSKKFQIVFCGDIAKMYRQFLVNPSQTSIQKIKYRRNPESQILSMRLLTLTYGTAPAGWLATRCLKELAIIHKDTHPEAAESIDEDINVDDVLTGSDSKEKAAKLLKDIITILSSAQLKLRKFVSNCPEILEDIPSEDRIEIDEESTIKTLGIVWNPLQDTLSINLKSFDTSQPVSKRIVLSESVQIFNPTGEFNPIVVKAKIFLQTVFNLKIDWDTNLPDPMSQEWNKFRLELCDLPKIQIPRFVLIENHTEIQLHGFCDASEKAYGACIYLRSYDGRNLKSALLFAKSRVAPLYKQTLARLELCAAELLATIFQKVEEVMGIQYSKRILWSDSTITLSWISTPSNRLNTYVANRVSRIQSLTKNCHWRHIKGTQNPADILSRGCSPTDLAESTIWWNGPSFLRQPETQWPEDSFKIIEAVPETKPTVIPAFIAKNEYSWLDKLASKWNSVRPLQRVVAYCNRFVLKFRSKFQKSKPLNFPEIPTGPLKVSELQNGLKIVIRHFQKREFTVEYLKLEKGQEIDPKSRLKSLSPFFDQKDKLIRVGGRLQNTDYSFAFKHQILLPDCQFTTNLLQDLHYECLHVGQKSLLSIVRHRFWPLRARDKIRHICRHCIQCFKVNPSEIQQFQGQLPKDRFAFIHAFLYSGVDCAGPVLIKSGTSRNAPSQKAFIVLFICLATKAIHLELATSMSTESFLAAIDRFFSTRGLSNKMYSDNGSNFIGAAREFRELQELLNSEDHKTKIETHCSNKFVEWKFIPPRAPQFGGIWESAVKLTKYHLARVLGNSLLTFEEYYTVLKKVEAILNSRPLTPESDDPTDLRVLTPGHFLIGRPLISKPEENIAEVPMYRLTRLRRLQSYSQQMWKRFSDEYVHQLQQMSKNFKHQITINKGDMVLLKDESPSTLDWVVGRITNTYPGKDGIVRVVDVKTAKGEFRRPVTKIAKLPLEATKDTSHFSPAEDVVNAD